MKCKKIQKLILTDYSDGELDQALKDEIKSHISTCSSCRQLEENLKKQIIYPLKKTERVEAPEEIWRKIKETIEGPERENAYLSIQELLASLFAIRKPLLAAVSIVLVLLIGGGILTRSYFTERTSMNVFMEDQLDFLDSLTNGNGSKDSENGMWTEEFFL